MRRSENEKAAPGGGNSFNSFRRGIKANFTTNGRLQLTSRSVLSNPSHICRFVRSISGRLRDASLRNEISELTEQPCTFGNSLRVDQLVMRLES